MNTTRRRAIVLASSGIIGGLSGCSGFFDGSNHTLTLQLANYTDRQNRVAIELIDPDEDDYTDARESRHEVTVPAALEGETAGTAQETTAVPRQHYIVRTLLQYGNWKTDHYHFFPGEGTTDQDESFINIRIYKHDETGIYYVRFM